MSSERGKEYAGLAHLILTMENPMPIGAVADALGLSYDVFYSRLRGSVSFSPDEVKKLFEFTKDERFIEYFLQGSDYFLAERSTTGQASSEKIERQVARIILEASDVLRAVEVGLEDSRLDHRDKAKIKAEVLQAEKALASLRTLLEG